MDPKGYATWAARTARTPAFARGTQADAAKRRQCSYNADMTALTIRDIPEDQIQTLKTRAAQAGKSLQSFMQELIARETSKPTLAEMMERLDRETTAAVSTADVLAAIDEGRAGR